MAPKVKFTKSEMTEAAVQVVRQNGIAGLTAKSLATQLGTSTQPIFTCFATMEAVKAAVLAAATQIYNRYTAEGLDNRIPFFGFGMQYIRFARNEPELYRLLFLSSEQPGDAMGAMAHSQTLLQPTLMKIYRIGAAEADRYFRDMWLVVHGLATLIVTGGCPYDDDEIGRILTEVSVSICKSIKEIPGFAEGTFDRDAVFRALVDAPHPNVPEERGT